MAFAVPPRYIIEPEKLEALLRDRFALVNEKIQGLRMDVSW